MLERTNGENIIQNFFCLSKVTKITYSQHGPSFINLFVQYSQSDLPPLRPLCGEAPSTDLNPGH